MPAERVLSLPDYALWPLAGLMAGMDVAKTITTAERLAEAPLPGPERGELSALLIALAGARFSADRLLRVVRSTQVTNELLRETGFHEFLFELLYDGDRDKPLADVKARAEAEGQVEGRIEGRVEGMRQAIQLALTARFGALDDALTDALDHADDATLHGLLTHMATDTLDQVRERLGLPSAG
ncbi:MAG TPA: hypothetical protein VIC85_13750 [Ktedonobacterales bacterium]|jgi:hypothetical protein